MLVLLVTPCFPPTWAYGGIPRVVYGLGRALVRAGAKVRVWTTDAFDAARRAPVPPRYDLDGIDVHVARNLSNRLAWAHQLYLPWGRPPMEGVELVHLHAHRHLLNHTAFEEAGRRQLPVVQTPNGTALPVERKVLVKRAWDRVFDGEVPRRADRVVAVSRAEARSLLGWGVPAERIVHIPNGLCLDEFADLPPRGSFRARHALDDRPIVAYLGQITPRKGVEHLVAAGARLGTQARLVVAGAPRGMALPEAPGVYFPGTLEGAERLALLVDADVLVYPSTAEVFGLVPMEGLLCGAPVVVGNDCGCGEVVAEAGAGLLTAHGDVERLSGAIRSLLEDRATASAMVRRGRRYIEANLDFDRIAERHLQLYEELLRSRGRRAAA